MRQSERDIVTAKGHTLLGRNYIDQAYVEGRSTIPIFIMEKLCNDIEVLAGHIEAQREFINQLKEERDRRKGLKGGIYRKSLSGRCAREGEE